MYIYIYIYIMYIWASETDVLHVVENGTDYAGHQIELQSQPAAAVARRPLPPHAPPRPTGWSAWARWPHGPHGWIFCRPDYVGSVGLLLTLTYLYIYIYIYIHAYEHAIAYIFPKGWFCLMQGPSDQVCSLIRTAAFSMPAVNFEIFCLSSGGRDKKTSFVPASPSEKYCVYNTKWYKIYE